MASEPVASRSGIKAHAGDDQRLRAVGAVETRHLERVGDAAAGCECQVLQVAVDVIVRDRHRVAGGRHGVGVSHQRRDSNIRWSRQNTNSRAPITMRVHQELRLPSKAISVWMMPRISTPNSVPAT